MERHVFTMLHRAKDAEALAAIPLIQSVCRRMGIAGSTAALQRMVCGALPGNDPKTIRLRNAILGVDFDRVAGNTEVAGSQGISRRHFARLRAQAVSAIARYAQSFVESEPGGAPDARFERERAAFGDAQKRGASLEMRNIAKNLTRVAKTQRARGIARAALAEANVHCGRAGEARELLESLPPAAAQLGRAKLALLRGATDEALERALKVARNGERHERAAAALLAARICREDSRLCWPDSLEKPPRQTWEGLCLEVECAYRAVSAAQLAIARRAAAASLAKAEQCGFLGVAAGAAAILHSVALADGNLAQAMNWRSLALARLLRSADPLVAAGLFRERIEIREAVDPSLAVFYCRLCAIVPQMLSDSKTQRAAVLELSAATLERAAGDGSATGRLEAAIDGVIRSDSAFAHYAQTCFAQLHETFALVAAATLGVSWSAALALLSEPLAHSVTRLHPSRRRAIPIVLLRKPESQNARAEHLRVDDGTPGGQESKPDFAGLRVRIVSLRSRESSAVSWCDKNSAAGAPSTALDFAHSR
ncbi:MAG TPA: hypothetical protein VGI19_09965 [Candidatus Cybelea sp.]